MWRRVTEGSLCLDDEAPDRVTRPGALILSPEPETRVRRSGLVLRDRPSRQIIHSQARQSPYADRQGALVGVEVR